MGNAIDFSFKFYKSLQSRALTSTKKKISEEIRQQTVSERENENENNENNKNKNNENIKNNKNWQMVN